MTQPSFLAALPSINRVVKGAHPLWMVAPVLVLLLIAYCEVHSRVTGTPHPGLAVSGSWAVLIASGWAVAVAALHRFGPRIASSSFATTHPWLTAIAATAAIAAFTLACEWLLSSFSDRWSSLFSFLYARVPMHAAASAMLVAIFARLRPATPPTPVESAPPHIEVMTGTGHTTISVADIEWLKAERNYVNVMHRSGRVYLLRQTMAALGESLDAKSFARIHRSIIVNRGFVKERRAGGTLVLQSGTIVRVSRAYRDALQG